MKRILLLILGLGATAAAQRECNLASVVGTYGVFYSPGWTAIAPGSPVPAPPGVYPGVYMGVMSIDYNGKPSGAQTMVTVGAIFNFQVVGGKVEINSDCTGTLQTRLKVKGTNEPPIETVERIIVLPDQREIYTITTDTGVAGSQYIGLGVWKRMSPVPATANW